MTSEFVFVICQNGAEAVCKTELLTNHAGLKFAFSRPGFLTFKCQIGALPEKFHLKSTFARTYGWSIGNTRASNLKDQLTGLLQSKVPAEANHLHIWQRDSQIPGSRGFEPGPSLLAQQSGEQVVERLIGCGRTKLQLNRNANANELVFDIIMVEPDNWWHGCHFATSRFQRWPGGVPRLDLEKQVISRAWYKLHEALLWSGIRINKGDVCAEIGSSPGGACQLLLEKGAKVIVIDPAELDPEIEMHPDLVYLRCRGREVPKKKLKDVRWLLSDVNAAPAYTLDTIEEIVTNQHVTRVQGLILTLKISDWKLAAEIPAWQNRIRRLGFQLVRTRQLAFNRREICLVALRDQFALRASRKRSAKSPTS